MKSVVVFCGSSLGNHPEFSEMAYDLGGFLAKQNISLIYGGGKVGLMGKVAQGALDEGGTVIGVIPDFLKEKEVHHEGLTKLISVKTMHERKVIMHELSEGVIALPGGFGTLEEVFEMITWAQLGLHQKAIGILNVNQFYQNLLLFMQNMVDQGFLKKENLEMLLVDISIDGLIARMISYIPKHVPKWINKEQT